METSWKPGSEVAEQPPAGASVSVIKAETTSSELSGCPGRLDDVDADLNAGNDENSDKTLFCSYRLHD